jgi:hypothetical protein
MQVDLLAYPSGEKKETKPTNKSTEGQFYMKFDEINRIQV